MAKPEQNPFKVGDVVKWNMWELSLGKSKRDRFTVLDLDDELVKYRKEDIDEEGGYWCHFARLELVESKPKKRSKK